MGSLCTQQESIQNNAIDKQLRMDNQRNRHVNQILFLGIKGSGRNTFFKQFQRIYGYGFDDDIRMEYKALIHQQCIHQMQMITDIFQQNHQFTESIAAQINHIHSIDHIYNMNTKTAKAIESIWNLSQIKSIYKEQQIHNMKIYASSGCFWDNISRISCNDYVPSDQDIISVCHHNKRIMELTFARGDNQFRVINPCFDSTHWRKWIQCFDDVDTIVFVASLSCYTCKTSSDNSLQLLVFGFINNNCCIDIPDELIHLIAKFCLTIRINDAMSEQLEFFHDIVHHYAFVQTEIVLFLNKRDLFQQLIETIPINICPAFDDYSWTSSYNNSLNCIMDRFEAMNDTRKQIYKHVTCATDASNVKTVFSNIGCMVVNAHLTKGGLIY